MKILKYLTLKNYYIYAARKILNFFYPAGKIKIVHTIFHNINILVRANEDVGKAILVNKFEIEELSYIKNKLSSNAIFIDIGANIGLFSLVIAAKSNSIRVHAFEPIKLNTNLLFASIEINGFTNITVNQKCIGNYDGEVDFSVSSDSAYSSILDSGRKVELKKIHLPIIKLDSYVSSLNITKISFVKIDVEGAEKLVIEGASHIFSTPLLRPEFLMIELCDINLKAFKTSIKEIVDLMITKEYKPFVLHKKELIEFDYKIHANKFENVFFENIKII